MRILHVIANLAPRYGGPAEACQEMAKAVALQGHDVHVVTSNQDGRRTLDVSLETPIIRDRVTYHYFPIQRPRFWGTSWPMARFLRTEIADFDVVHVHSLYMFHSLVAAHYCRLHRVPYLIRPHGSLDPFLQRRHRLRKMVMELLFENRNLKNASAIHFTTQEELRLATPFVFGGPGIVVPNALDWQKYAALPERGRFRRKYPALADKKIILFLGRINFKKGLDILSKAFGLVARSHPDIRLVIAGPDDNGLEKQVRAWLTEAGVLEKTVFTGMLLGEAKREVLVDADLFVLPSYSENFGMAVIEAMASGLPVVVSNHVNICDEIRKSGAGEVVPAVAAPLAEVLIRLLKNPDALHQMGECGRRYVYDHFTEARVGEELEQAYNNISK